MVPRRTEPAFSWILLRKSALPSARIASECSFSPFRQYGGIHDSKPKELFMFVIKELNDRHLAYLHLIEARGSEIGLTDELHENAVNNAVLFRSYSTDRCSPRKNPIM